MVIEGVRDQTVLNYRDGVLRQVIVSRLYKWREVADADAGNFEVHAFDIAERHGVEDWYERDEKLIYNPDMSDRMACYAIYTFTRAG